MKFIHPLVIIRILSTILLIESISFLLVIPVAIIYNESLSPIILSSLITFTVFLISRASSFKADLGIVTNRDGYLAVTLSWIIFTIMGSLPYLLSGSISSFFDAFFESASGFTTTGSTCIVDVEILPRSILFWRSLTHWIGGLGIIVLVIIILPSLRITAQQLLSLESSLKEKIHPKTKAVGFRILFIYLGLTIIEVIFLAIGDMDLFDSICHTFGTVATGGLSTRNSSIINYSAYSQYIIAIFMFLSGVSFVIYYYIVKLKFSKLKQNDELRFYGGFVLAAGLLTACILYFQAGKPMELAFREGFFQVISIITTTGYTTTDYLIWPASGVMLIFILLFAGACTGSTTGSIKMARHLVVIKNIRNVFTRLTHPNVITQVKLNNKPLSDKLNNSVVSFVIFYLFIFIIGTILVIVTGSDPVTSASAVASSLGNVGPGLGTVGPMFTYSHFPDSAKFLLSLIMIIGRLEIMTVFALFTRSFWKL